MFRKAQLKFFSIITSILLAVFIAVLGSVNLIMKAVMERQSRNVLKQIAEGVEYDDAASTFTFIHPDHDDSRHMNDIPSKPDDKPKKTTVTVTTASTSAAATTTTAAITTSYPVPETSENITKTIPEEETKAPYVPDEATSEDPPAEPETPAVDTQPPVPENPWENDRPPREEFPQPPEGQDWWHNDYPPYGPPGNFDPFKPHEDQYEGYPEQDCRDERRDGFRNGI